MISLPIHETAKKVEVILRTVGSSSKSHGGEYGDDELEEKKKRKKKLLNKSLSRHHLESPKDNDQSQQSGESMPTQL